MNYMVCTTCRCTVSQNNTGICLACQQGFIGVGQEDAYKPKTLMDKLEERKKVIEEELVKVKKTRKRKKKDAS